VYFSLLVSIVVDVINREKFFVIFSAAGTKSPVICINFCSQFGSPRSKAGYSTISVSVIPSQANFSYFFRMRLRPPLRRVVVALPAGGVATIRTSGVKRKIVRRGFFCPALGTGLHWFTIFHFFKKSIKVLSTTAAGNDISRT
jgi:hypothetical protein